MQPKLLLVYVCAISLVHVEMVHITTPQIDEGLNLLSPLLTIVELKATILDTQLMRQT
jgi:hypothetical protein